MSSVQRVTSTSQARPACAAWSGCGEGSTTVPPVLSTIASRPSWPVRASLQLLLAVLSGQLPCLVVCLAPIFIYFTLIFICFTLIFICFTLIYFWFTLTFICSALRLNLLHPRFHLFYPHYHLRSPHLPSDLSVQMPSSICLNQGFLRYSPPLWPV